MLNEDWCERYPIPDKYRIDVEKRIEGLEPDEAIAVLDREIEILFDMRRTLVGHHSRGYRLKDPTPEQLNNREYLFDWRRKHRDYHRDWMREYRKRKKEQAA